MADGHPISSVGNEADEQEIDGVTLCMKETVLANQEPLMSEIRTGSEFPYMSVNKSAAMQFDYRGDDSIMLLDESRLVLILVSYSSAVSKVILADGPQSDEVEGDEEPPAEKTRIKVMEF